MDLSLNWRKKPLCKFSWSYDDRYHIEFSWSVQTHAVTASRTHIQTTSGISVETYRGWGEPSASKSIVMLTDEMCIFVLIGENSIVLIGKISTVVLTCEISIIVLTYEISIVVLTGEISIVMFTGKISIVMLMWNQHHHIDWWNQHRRVDRWSQYCSIDWWNQLWGLLNEISFEGWLIKSALGVNCHDDADFTSHDDADFTCPWQCWFHVSTQRC